MEVKLFEVRDRMTFIPVMAVKLTYRDAAERYLLRRTGYDERQIKPGDRQDMPPYVLLTPLDGKGSCLYSPYDWPGRARTMGHAHRHIIDNWDDLSTGEVIDVEFILGEKPAKKLSESLGQEGL